MPRIVQRDPAWLIGSDQPAAELFQSTKPHGLSAVDDTRGPTRRIAHRGTEVFVAVGHELRWSDLALLKDWAPETIQSAYRVLKTPVHREIRQLTVSPSGDYIAILTSHTCHVCILPEYSHLQLDKKSSPLRIKSFQLGPTAHVLEQAPLISALWHPLSPSGNCLVTITLDACVRLWELDSRNRYSFDEPTLAIDLKKLGNATSMEADFRASKYGVNRGFSPDDVEMEVAAACFGGHGDSDEQGWASMTLWIAMSEGDVYALCPFLPSKWFAPDWLLPSLATSVVEMTRALKTNSDATERERKILDDQSTWLRHIDAQESIPGSRYSGFDAVEVYSRPDCLSAVPRLQGPFSILPDSDCGDITDIYVIEPKTSDELILDRPFEDEVEEQDLSLSVSIVCLASNDNQVRICLDLDEVQAEWLPRRTSQNPTYDHADIEKQLLLFEVVDLADTDGKTEDYCWPTFSPSPLTPYEIFVTNPSGVHGVSFRPWVGALESELSATTDVGAALRLNVMLETARSVVSQPIKISPTPRDNVSTAISLIDPSMGYFVMTMAFDAPFGAILDMPSAHTLSPDTPFGVASLPAPEPRAPYRPSPAFDQPSTLHQVTALREKEGRGSELKRQVRFSPATLQLMTEAHRILSVETNRLGLAAADLFRHCERMCAELREQVRRMAEIAERVDYATGRSELDDDESGDGDATKSHLIGNEEAEHRIDQVRHRNGELNTRIDGLRRKMLKLGGRQPSVKELAFVDEVVRLQHSIDGSEAQIDTNDSNGASSESADNPEPQQGALAARFDAVKRLHAQLLDEAKSINDSKYSSDEPQSGSGSGSGSRDEWAPSASTAGSIPVELRKQKMSQIMALLERESALIDGVTERLARLSEH